MFIFTLLVKVFKWVQTFCDNHQQKVNFITRFFGLVLNKQTILLKIYYQNKVRVGGKRNELESWARL